MTAVLEPVTNNPTNNPTDTTHPPTEDLHTGQLHVLGLPGEGITWNAGVAAEVAAAEQKFNQLTSTHAWYQSDTPGGETGERITKFDPLAGHIFAVPHLVGG